MERPGHAVGPMRWRDRAATGAVRVVELLAVCHGHGRRCAAIVDARTWSVGTGWSARRWSQVHAPCDAVSGARVHNAVTHVAQGRRASRMGAAVYRISRVLLLNFRLHMHVWRYGVVSVHAAAVGRMMLVLHVHPCHAPGSGVVLLASGNTGARNGSHSVVLVALHSV